MRISIIRDHDEENKTEVMNFFDQLYDKPKLPIPLEWQYAYMTMVFDDYFHYIKHGVNKYLEKDLLDGGAGVGKTYQMITSALCEMMFFGALFKKQRRQYIAVYASGTYFQLRDSVLATLDQILATTNFCKYFKRTNRELVYIDYPLVICNFRTSNASNPLSLKGCHPNGVIRIFLDELNAMPEGTLEVCTTFLGSVDARNGAATCGRITVASNPDKPGSTFHRLSDGLQPGWNRFHISRPDVVKDFSKDVLANSIREAYDGEDNPMYQNYVLGRHTMSSNLAVFPEHILMAACERICYNTPPYYMGVDCAGGGTEDHHDFSAYTIVSNNMVSETFRIQERTDKFGDRCFHRIQVVRPFSCYVDPIGVGKGIFDHIKMRVEEWNIQNPHDQIMTIVEGILNNDVNFRDMYSNRVTNIAHITRDWLRYVGCIPRDLEFSDVLLHELRTVMEEADADCRLKLWSKKKYKKSPDMAESLIYCFAGHSKAVAMHQTTPKHIHQPEQIRSRSLLSYAQKQLPRC